MNDLVSIITPTYNRPNWLKLTLASLLKQTYSNWECICVNDSGEDVSKVIEEFHDDRMKYFTNEKNIGLAATRNVALEKANGDYFIFLDDDDWLYNETLEFRMNRIKKYNADVVYSRVLRSTYGKNPNGYFQKSNTLYWDCNFDQDLILIQNIAPCNAVLFSRKAKEDAGKLDETLTTSEDWDFWVHMSRNNFFYETKIIDCECSFREDASQMTGSRTGFSDHLPYLYKKWRPFARNLDWVKEHQNAVLQRAGFIPMNYGL